MEQLTSRGPGRLELCGADLRGFKLNDVNLSGINLRGADLSDVDFRGVDLSSADLVSANFSRAQVASSNLDNANLSEAKLVSGWFHGTHFHKADLTRADLSDARLIHAQLKSAILVEANLSRANFSWTDLHSAIFEPRPDSIASMREIELADNLEFLTYRDTPTSLMVLRERFAKAGLREHERRVTLAKLRRQQIRQGKSDKLLDRVEAMFSFIAFDLTCGYGLYYGRPLWLLTGLILLMMFVYTGAICSHSRGAIWRVWASDRIRQDEGLPGIIRLYWSKPRWPGGPQRGLPYRVGRAFGLGLLFSLLSSFQIGWRELNVGNWISRVQPREYTLRATGWVRVVAGIQSLVSVYLLALWALTYFGRPFE